MTMRAPRPPMGWNSWDCFGGSVTEDEVLANAEYLAAHLLPLGFDTVTVDIQWSAPAPGDHEYVAQPVALDAWGRQLPAPNRFPSGVPHDSEARDLWSVARVPAAAGTLEIDVPPHGVRLLTWE